MLARKDWNGEEPWNYVPKHRRLPPNVEHNSWWEIIGIPLSILFFVAYCGVVGVIVLQHFENSSMRIQQQTMQIKTLR